MLFLRVLRSRLSRMGNIEGVKIIRWYFRGETGDYIFPQNRHAAGLNMLPILKIEPNYILLPGWADWQSRRNCREASTFRARKQMQMRFLTSQNGESGKPLKKYLRTKCY